MQRVDFMGNNKTAALIRELQRTTFASPHDTCDGVANVSANSKNQQLGTGSATNRPVRHMAHAAWLLTNWPTGFVIGSRAKTRPGNRPKIVRPDRVIQNSAPRSGRVERPTRTPHRSPQLRSNTARRSPGLSDGMTGYAKNRRSRSPLMRALAVRTKRHFACHALSVVLATDFSAQHNRLSV